jgi:AmpD protein
MARPARYIASPNCDPRPAATPISLVVIHGISLPPGQFGGDAIKRLFTNRLNPHSHPYYAGVAERRLSAHFLIRRNGSLVQFVPCGLRAWHAGVSVWNGREGCNDYSLGIEIEGTDDRPYTGAQYKTLGRLVDAICRHYPIEAIVGHSDIAPGRKTDPGRSFDWRRLKNRGQRRPCVPQSLREVRRAPPAGGRTGD